MKAFFALLFLLIIGLEIQFLYEPLRKDLSAYAEEVAQKCSEKSYRPPCYDIEIPKLMNRISMEDAFKVTKMIQEQDSEYLYCHVLGHNLSYREASRPGADWKNIITRCPTTMCNNGCLHGSILKAFNNEYLTDEQIEQIKPDLPKICEPRHKWNPVGVEKSMCYHGMGHLVMFMTKANIPKSIDLCNFLAIKPGITDYSETCIQGIFMQIFQPLEPEDFELVEGLTPEKNSVKDFCSNYSGVAYNACYRESWYLIKDEIKKPEVLSEFCSYTDEFNAKRNCYASSITMLPVLFVIHEKNLDKMADYCRRLEIPWSKYCIADSAVRLIRIDPSYAKEAITLCGIADRLEMGEDCHKSLVHDVGFSFRKGSKESLQYCDLMQNPWKDECIKVISKI